MGFMWIMKLSQADVEYFIIYIYISIISKKVLFTKYIWPTFDEVEQLFKSSFVWRDLKFVLHIYFSPGQQM